MLQLQCPLCSTPHTIKHSGLLVTDSFTCRFCGDVFRLDDDVDLSIVVQFDLQTFSSFIHTLRTSVDLPPDVAIIPFRNGQPSGLTFDS